MCILAIIIRLTHENVWESMGKPCSCMQFIKSCIFYCKSRESRYQSRENPYQVLQVTRTGSERAMKLKDKIIITIVPSYTGKNITSLLPLTLLLVLRTRYNKDSNKLVIFYSIAWYYGDDYNYITASTFLLMKLA